MSTLADAVCAVTLAEDGTVPEWVQLFPAGRMTGRDGRRFTLDDPQAVIAAFEADDVDLPVDYHHQNDRPDLQKNGPVPAAGWIKALKMKADGLWARVDWTDHARELIAQKAYRYISPVFFHRRDGTRGITQLKGAGLVHNPNLHLMALASQEESMSSDNLLASRLAAMLGLREEATGDEVAAAVETFKAAAEHPDPAKFVPIEALRDVLNSRNTAISRMSEERVQNKIDDALRRGHISPAMVRWATALCTRDEASFDHFLEMTAPPFAYLAEEIVPNRPPPGAAPGGGESPEAEAVCAQLGLKAGTLGG